MNSILRYKNDSDRVYGVVGMTIAMYLWGGESLLASVSMEREVGQSLEFTPAYGFGGNPRLTASLAWREMRKQFEMTAAMIMGNAFCRSYVGLSFVLNDEIKNHLRDIIRREGSDSCSFETDESDTIYNKTQRYLDRIFSHYGVVSLARDFADTLQRNRTLSSGEVMELLSPLNRM